MKSPIPFQGFDERGTVRIYQAGDLPHWRQDGCTYFVTFRLADALPQSVVFELREERHVWLKSNGIDPKASDWKERFAKLTSEKQREYERTIGKSLNQRLDEGLGSCSLRNPECQRVLADALDFFHGDRVWTRDYVIMPNHVHVLMAQMPGFELEGILKSVRGYAAREINQALGLSGIFWQRESYDHIVRDLERLERFQKYIRANPSKAKLKNEDYHLSEEAIYELA